MATASFAQRVEELREDRRHGGSWLARRAVEALLEVAHDDAETCGELHARLVAAGRELAQLHATLHARVAVGLLVRRRVDRHEQDPLEIQRHQRLLRADQMTEMRRIERPAEQPDPHPGRTWPSPSTRYLVVHSSRRPIGPRACSFWVELPISAPMPNWPPSVKRVDALT